MAIFIVVVGLLVYFFMAKTLLWGAKTVGKAGLKAGANIAYKNYMRQPLSDSQKAIMDEYDKRLRHGDMSQAEIDYILANRPEIQDLFAKYYSGTVFGMDLLIRYTELLIEQLSHKDDPTGSIFHQIKEYEMDLENYKKLKHQKAEEAKDKNIDYYGNHGLPTEEYRFQIGDKFTIEDLDTHKIEKYTIVEKEKQDVDNGLISNNSPIALKVVQSQMGDIIELSSGDKTYRFKILSKNW